METMVYFRVNGTEICGRVEPTAAKNAGETMRCAPISTTCI